MTKDNSLINLIAELRNDLILVKSEFTRNLIDKEICNIIQQQLKNPKSEEETIIWDRELRVQFSLIKRLNKRGGKAIPKKWPSTLDAPALYDIKLDLISKIAFALFEIEKGDVSDVVSRLIKLEPQFNEKGIFKKVQPLLNRLYNLGIIDGQKRLGSTGIKYQLPPRSFLF